ncbi:MAG: MarR family transcriptional regulator [Lachnospiraceae bacterium]|nr:MarR family transcriptional regulator [Lachnospiraceae bacterium]
MEKSISQIIALLARKNQVYLSNMLEEYDITVAEQPFFLEMNHQKGLTQEELTALVCVDKAATTRALKSLEAKGYLIRLKDENDKRQNRIYPTKKAQQLESAVRNEILCFNIQLTQGIDPQILDMIYSGLLKMEENITGSAHSDSMMMKSHHTAFADWPVKIWNIYEIPGKFREQALSWIKSDFAKYEFVYVPRQYTNPDSFAYLFGYGEDQLLYIKENICKIGKKGGEKINIQQIELDRHQIQEVLTFQELLNARFVLYYEEENELRTLKLPYNSSAYFLYNPFLNWILGIERDFDPGLAELKNPRPQKLCKESLVMYNYSLNAYRLGESFQNYTYESQPFIPAKKGLKNQLKEWLSIPMERGQFEAYRFGYQTECRYVLGKR